MIIIIDRKYLDRNGLIGMFVYMARWSNLNILNKIISGGAPMKGNQNPNFKVVYNNYCLENKDNNCVELP